MAKQEDLYFYQERRALASWLISTQAELPAGESERITLVLIR